MNLTETIEGLERYPVNLRFPTEIRDDLENLKALLLVTPTRAQISLAQVAEVKIVEGPPMLKSENARLNGWTFVDIRGVDVKKPKPSSANKSSCRPADNLVRTI